jgi:glycerol dehydrogenase-like iron-containing ADH family enzyme
VGIEIISRAPKEFVLKGIRGLISVSSSIMSFKLAHSMRAMILNRGSRSMSMDPVGMRIGIISMRRRSEYEDRPEVLRGAQCV